MSKNREVADVLMQIARLLELKGENQFRIGTYVKAARMLDGMTVAIETVNDLRVLPGIGPSLSGKIQEFLETGKCTYLEDLKAKIPAGLLAMLEVPGVGPSKVKQLHAALGITTVEELEEACKQNRLVGLPSFGSVTQQNILTEIQRQRERPKRYLLGDVMPLVGSIILHMTQSRDVKEITEAGSVRRRKDTIRDVDILVSTTNAGPVGKLFMAYPGFKEVKVQGGTKITAITHNNVQVDLRMVPPESMGAAKQYFTGSKNHNIKLRQLAKQRGLKINEYNITDDQGRVLGGIYEQDIYRLLDLDYVPPELREDQGEIEAAAEHRLPQLITFSDLKGDLHVHTNWSDGHNTIDEMAQAAAAMGYEYIAICDHSKGLGIANGMSEDKALQQLEEIKSGSYPIKVLAGIEVDIRADGTYDYPVDLLEKFDVVVASVHSALNQDAATMTRRIDRALDAFAPTILGHPTGRMLNKRDGINVDMNFIMACCRTHNVAMEINAAPDRLDLDDINARLAVQRGVKLAINTDAHNIEQLGWIYYGVAVARRAWITKEDLYYYGGA